MSFITLFSLFYLSLTPLWISIAFIDAKNICENAPNLYTEIISITCIVIGLVFSIIIVIVDFRKNKIVERNRYILKMAKEEKIMTAEYVLSYVLPLLAFDFTIWYDVLLFLLFFFVLLFLYIRHNRLGANIILEMCGYTYYQCELLNEDNIVINKNVISRDDLLTKTNNYIYTESINNEYHLDRS